MNKRWVIPDIHGYCNTLCTLIENQIKPQIGDRIYFLGDYIDRGPNSKGVIDYLISKRKLGFEFKFIMGNHEDYFLKAYFYESLTKGIFKQKNFYKEAWFKNGGWETVKSFNISKLNEIQNEYIEWVKGLIFYIEEDDFIFVHAGLNFNEENPFEDKHAMLWIRDFKVVPEKIGNKKIIHGHVPFSIKIIKNNINNMNCRNIGLDNGIYIKSVEGFGNLLALELNSLELLIQPNVD